MLGDAKHFVLHTVKIIAHPAYRVLSCGRHLELENVQQADVSLVLT